MEDSRLDQLQQRVQRLESATATGSTPVSGIAGFIAIIGFIALIVNVPLPGISTDGQRLGLGLGAAFAAFVLTGLAITFAKFALRALVEIALVTVVFLNAVAAVSAWISWSELADLVASWRLAYGDEARVWAFGLTAAAMFVVDVVLMLILYPLAKVAGCDILD